MTQDVAQDWEGENLHDMLREIRGGSVDERRTALRAFDWDSGDMRQLGWNMSQKGLDLGTAIEVFLNGHPERFNYMRKDKVPLDDQPRCLQLDAIHRRIVSGFYLPDPEGGLGVAFDRILAWVENQEEDRAKGRQGRWVFDPALFTPITLKAIQAEQDDEVEEGRAPAQSANARDLLDPSIFSPKDRPKRGSLWRDLLGPFLG